MSTRNKRKRTRKPKANVVRSQRRPRRPPQVHAPTPQRELASALFVTPNTLRTHLRAIYRKLGAESRDDAVIRARERGLI